MFELQTVSHRSDPAPCLYHPSMNGAYHSMGEFFFPTANLPETELWPPAATKPRFLGRHDRLELSLGEIGRGKGWIPGRLATTVTLGMPFTVLA